MTPTPGAGRHRDHDRHQRCGRCAYYRRVHDLRDRRLGQHRGRALGAAAGDDVAGVGLDLWKFNFATVHVWNADGALEELDAFVREALSSSYEKEDIWPRELALALERRGLKSLSEVKLAKAVELADCLDKAGELNGWLGGILRRTSVVPRGLIS
jgi:hypothetical protein